MKKYTIILFLFFVSLSFGQRKYAANRYFKEFAYVKSAELYEAIYRKGDSSQAVLSGLGDSYYLNSKIERAVYWYGKLFHLYEKETIAPEFYFKYAQSLKSNGNYKESDEWMLKLREIKGSDSRSDALVLNKNYFKDFTEDSNTYVKLRNLSVNTKFSDYGVFMMADKVLFSSSRPEGALKKNKLYAWNKQPFLNIYEAKELITTNDVGIKYIDFKEVTKQACINTKYHDASAVVTKDGKTMYFTRDNYDGKKLRGDKNNTAHLKIYSASFIDNKWTNITDVSFNNNTYSTGQPALSADETALYFVSDMPGGFGATDLYKATILANNQFSKPVNLGDKINTEGKEMFPFVSAENILYFSSNGHIGLGSLDVFESKITEKGYQLPENLGTPINSSKDDFSFILNKEKEIGYFSSNREGGKGGDDMYSFFINAACEGLLEGIVYDKNTQKIITGAKIHLIDKLGKIIERRTSDALGFFSFGNIVCNLEYTVSGGQVDYESDLVLINSDKKLPVNIALNLTPIIIEDQIVINPIRFDFDKFDIREDAEYELEKIVSVLKEHTDIVIKIASHTDARGTSSYNKILSDRRAKATRNYILTRGIAADRIESAIGYGEEELLNECDTANLKRCTEEEHQLNRRSYFYIVRGNNVKVVND
jgi:outer membrane protein OmpA-like peptidoglycan-associated protein